MNQIVFYIGAILALFFMITTLLLLIGYSIPIKLVYLMKSKGYFRFPRLTKWHNRKENEHICDDKPTTSKLSDQLLDDEDDDEKWSLD